MIGANGQLEAVFGSGWCRVLRVQGEARRSAPTRRRCSRSWRSSVLMINQRGRRRRPCRPSLMRRRRPWPGSGRRRRRRGRPLLIFLLLEPDAGIRARHDDAALGYFSCGLEQLGLRHDGALRARGKRLQWQEARGAERQQEVAAAEIPRSPARRPVAAARGGRWARARARRCKGLQVQNASSVALLRSRLIW